VLVTLDEELVERYESNNSLHNEKAGNVKDGIRDHAIGDICGLFQQALSSFEIFDEDTVNECLRVTAQLIDWNTLDYFEQIIFIAKNMLAASSQDKKFMPFRKNALKVIHAVVDKGMDYPNKI